MSAGDTENRSPARPPLAAMYDLVFGYRVSQAVYVAAKLGIADLVKDGPRPVAELAEASGTHAPSLYRLLRALASVGVFAERDDGCFELTSLAETLQSDTPRSMRPIAILYGEPFRWRPWGELLHSVRTGRTAFDDLYGVGAFEYFDRHPEAGAIFDAAMIAFTAWSHRAIAAGYDFSVAQTVVDVGGGRGGLLAAVLERHLAIRGVLFDRPEVMDGARARLAQLGLLDRCELVGGDFFAHVPEGHDVYLLQRILHDWDDERAVAILATCRRAMRPGARLLAIETPVPPGNAPHAIKLVDLNMLVVQGGRERTEAEYRELFAEAGFASLEVVAVRPGLTLLEARAASAAQP